MEDLVLVILLSCMGIAALVLMIFALVMFRQWFRLFLSGGRASLIHVIAMRLRGNPVNLIVDAYIMLVQSGTNVSLGEVESYYVVNRSRIMSAADLYNCLHENPVEKQVQVWIDVNDLAQLADLLSARASAIRNGDGVGYSSDTYSSRQEEETRLTEEAELCERVAECVQTTMRRGARS